jgi:hypothetical protein
MKTTRAAPAAVCLLLAATALWAGGGIAELRLDAAAVAEVLGAALPEPGRVEVPGLGEMTVRLGPVRNVVFRDGGVEAAVAMAVEEVRFAQDVWLRFVPEIDRRTGTARLVLERSRVAGLPFDIDLGDRVPPATLPRSVHWDLEMPGARVLPVDCYVQGIAVEEDRLRIDLGLVAGEAAGRVRTGGRGAQAP